MSIGLRPFLIEDDDSVHPLPLARFEGVAMERSEPMPRYAGRRVRYVMAVVEVENRIAVAVSRLEYGYLAFDDRGYADEAALEEEMATAVAMLKLPRSASAENVGGHHHFARKRYAHEYQWQPSRALHDRLVMAALAPRTRRRGPRPL